MSGDVWAEYEGLASGLSNAAFGEGMQEYREGVYDVTLRKFADAHRARRAALDDFVRRLVEDRERIDWLEANFGVAVLPVEGNIMPAGTWCVEPPDAQTDDDVHMASTLRAAIDAARGATGQEQAKP